MSDTDDSFNFLISMCYTQLFNLLCEKADDVYGGRLPVHVRCLIDECANIGQIPKLEKLVATIRSREISALYDLTTLQRDANRLLGFTAQQTLCHSSFSMPLMRCASRSCQRSKSYRQSTQNCWKKRKRLIPSIGAPVRKCGSF